MLRPSTKKGTAKAAMKIPATTGHRAGEQPIAINTPDEMPAGTQNKVMPSGSIKNIPVRLRHAARKYVT
jgi:hypothetical protein